MATEEEERRRRIEALSSRDIARGLQPEIAQARRGLERYKKARRGAIWGGAWPGQIAKTPGYEEAQRGRVSRSAEQQELLDQRAALLDKIAAYKASTNNDERLKLAAEIYKSYWSSQASIVSATVGAKGRVLAAKLNLKGDMMGAVARLSSEYSMDGAPKEAHTIVSNFRSTLSDFLPLDQTMTPDNMSALLLQRVAADLKQIADPNLQKRVLSAMNAEMAA